MAMKDDGVLAEVTLLVQAGDLFRAGELCQHLLREHPADPMLLQVMGEIEAGKHQRILQINQECMEALVRLDAAQDFQGIVRFLTSRPCVRPGLLKAIRYFLANNRLPSALSVATFLFHTGQQDPLVSLTLAVGGLVLGQPDLEQQGLDLLHGQTPLLTANQQEDFQETIQLLMPTLLLDTFRLDRSMVLKVLEIFKAAMPRFRSVFDRQAPMPVLSRTGQARLFQHPCRPVGIPRPVRRVVLAVHNPSGSPYPDDHGWRLAAALDTYGWRTVIDLIVGQDLAQDARNIIERCRQHDADILVFDDHVFLYGAARDPQVNIIREQMIRQLRQERPHLKMVGTHFDYWIYPCSVLEESVRHLDALWPCAEPSLACLQRQAFANKIVYMPFPMGLCGVPATPLIPRLYCSANVSAHNYTRAFWLAAAEDMGLPIDRKPSLAMTPPVDQTPLDDYARYMQGLAAATCCVAFTMRRNLTPMATGSVFEIIMMGSLLVAEVTPDLHRYFIPGEHYLEFSSLAELAAITRFVAEHPAEAEAIRRAGNAFAREHYSDEKMIGCMDVLLYPDGA